MSASLTVLADDSEELDDFREALSGISRVHVAERMQSGGASLAWALAVRPVVQVLRLDLHPRPVRTNGQSHCLSAREVEVVRLLARGNTYMRVGDCLGVTANTVATHLKSVYRKLSVHSAPAAVMRAVELRLIEPDE